MSGMHSRDESSESHEERPTKRQKVTEFKKDDFENCRLLLSLEMSLETLNVGYDDSSEERDYKLMKSPGVVKLLKNCLASSKCDIAQPAKCQCRSCLYTKYGHVVFVPHDAHQDGEEGPGEKCAECISVEGTVRGQYAVEISDHLPLSPEVQHDLACHFRVFREILSKMFSISIQDLRKRMSQVKIESMPALQEEMLRLKDEINMSSNQLHDLNAELERTFEAMIMSGVDSLTPNDLSMPESIPTLVHLQKPEPPKTESLEEEIKRLKTENARLGKKVQQLEEEKLDIKSYGVQSVPIKFFTSDRNLDSRQEG